MTNLLSPAARRMLLLLALLAALPFLTSPIRGTRHEPAAGASDAANEAMRFARAAAVRRQQFGDETRRLLEAIAGLSSIADKSASTCAVFFARQLAAHPAYANFGLARPNGKVLCSAVPPPRHFALAGHDGHGSQLAGSPHPAEIFTAPITDEADGVRAVVFAVLDPAGLSAIYADPDWPPGSSLVLADGAGRQIAYFADTRSWLADDAPDSPLTHALPGRTLEAAGQDETMRAYAIAATPGQAQTVAFGTPSAVPRNPAQPPLDLLAAGLTLALALVIALAGTGRWRLALERVKSAPATLGRIGRGILARRGDIARRLRALRPRADATGLREANETLQRTVEQLQRRTHEMVRLNEMAHLLQMCASAEEIDKIAAQFGQELFAPGSGTVFLTQGSDGALKPSGGWGDLPAGPDGFKPDHCWAMRLGKTHFASEAHPAPLCPHLGEAPPQSHACIPLLAHGEIIGTLHIQGGFPHPPADAAELSGKVKLAEEFAERLALALSNLRLREALHARSIRDPLTGLYNRRFLEETMAIEEHRARRDGSTIGLVMIDIDHFKRFNDSYGHAAGDAVLRGIGSLLRAHIREGDIPCRYGGEEFTLILPQTTLETARARAEQLRESAARLRVEYEGRSLAVTLSLGVACFPGHGASWQEVLQTADGALYHAKRQGRNRVVAA